MGQERRTNMRKLILKSFLSPGDIVMLTAAVRDLHRCYPNQFVTDVRTLCPELWENNPYITPIPEADPGVEFIECSYPLIDRSSDAPCHCLHGFIDFLNTRLGLAIKPTEFKGDIHLSDLEKSWYSQVHEVTRRDIPFWIVSAGGKYDVTVKWWETRRYQKVVDYFRGKIQFVQIGELGHHHPPLKGVIDLRGQTNLRELVRLVYHCQGVLCPITAVMHLAPAVEGKAQGSRPCVVVAGGREPAHWEAYPNHQFIQMNGALPCCQNQGCWKDRTMPLGDGDERDQEDHLCVQVTGGLPRCMDMITSADVIRRIELYFQGGIVEYLSDSEAKAARRGVLATRSNSFDQQPLNIHTARKACEGFIPTIPDCPTTFNGRGVVISGGGVKYFTNAWVCINMLRRSGCALPIQLWFLGKEEVDKEMTSLIKSLEVDCIDATAVRKHHPARILGGWGLKPYAILNSSFREVLFLDADNVPMANPEFLFESPEYRQTGAIFWPDYGQLKKTQAIWDNCGLPRPEGPEFESGQIVVDKQRCWNALCLAMWFNENSDFYYQHLYGDKETFHLAFEKLNQSYSMPAAPVHRLEGTMCQHDFSGNRLFQHRNTDKWNLFLRNKKVEDFWFEEECRGYVKQLQEIWDGRMSYYGVPAGGRPSAATLRGSERGQPCPRDPKPAQKGGGQSGIRSHPVQVRSSKAGVVKSLRIEALMISCQERTKLREQTLRNLAATDWGDKPVWVQLDEGQSEDRRERQTRASYLALLHGIQTKPDYLLFLEDDLEFNRSILHNLRQWAPLRDRQITLAGLYNPNLNPLAWGVRTNSMVVAPHSIFGSQAFLLSLSAARHIVRRWSKMDGMQDIRISRLAGQLEQPIFYHVPSLVQHVGISSIWGGPFHQAVDYDASWKSDEQSAKGPLHPAS